MTQLDLHSTQQRKHRYRKATKMHLAIDNKLDRNSRLSSLTNFGVAV
jgi:hypothetical protein